MSQINNFDTPTFKGKYGYLGVFFVVLAIFPLFLNNRVLASEILIYGLYALSWDILFGHMGSLSFGHAAFFGLGAYGAAVVSYYYKLPILAALACGVALSAAASVIIGYIATRLRGMGFAMVTLAIAQILYFSGTEMAFIHAEDGLTAYRSNLDLGFYTLNLGSSLVFYYFVLFFVAGSLVVIYKMINSPFGSVLHAIRENETRTLTVGYPVLRYKLMAFIISGTFAGLSGALFCMLMKFADLDYLYWHKSGQAVMMTLVGGMRSLYGPFIGSFLMCMIEDVASKYWMNWPIILGVIFVICILFAKGGIWGGIVRLAGRFGKSEEKIQAYCGKIKEHGLPKEPIQ
jgi:branched-chain amino acid transport system permease protein